MRINYSRFMVLSLAALAAVVLSLEGFAQDRKATKKPAAVVSSDNGPSGDHVRAKEKYASASDKKPSRKSAAAQKRPAGLKDSPSFTPEREAAALTFVRQHHPELAKLLVQLKAKHNREYHRAVRDLFRTSERLAGIREKDTARHELELKAWKTKSRIQLLAARLRMSPDDAALRIELEQALSEQIDLQLAKMQHERTRLTERLKKIDTQIERLNGTRGGTVDKQLQLLIRGKKPAGTTKTVDSEPVSLRKSPASGGGKSNPRKASRRTEAP